MRSDICTNAKLREKNREAKSQYMRIKFATLRVGGAKAWGNDKKDKRTHFRPRQPRGPREKGWLASLTSRQAGSIHLSGLN